MYFMFSGRLSLPDDNPGKKGSNHLIIEGPCYWACTESGSISAFININRQMFTDHYVRHREY